MQDQQSFFWDAYLDTIRAVIWEEVKNLRPAIRQAIWFQTEQGMEWDPEPEPEQPMLFDEDRDERDRTPPFDDDEVIGYVLNEYVLSAAADWHNWRIDGYLRRAPDNPWY